MNRRTDFLTQVPIDKMSRNLFDLSHEVKMSGKFGYLYPVLVEEMLPGDTYRHQQANFIRLASLVGPAMHKVEVKSHAFFVPTRIICDQWEEFSTGGQDGMSTIALPYITPAGIYAEAAATEPFVKSTLWDYLGLPPCPAAPGFANFSTEQISPFPFKVYQKIWNDWYRDPNFDTEVDLDTDTTGNQSVAWYTKGWWQLKRRGWRKDYFTASLAQPQRGSEVLMPLQGTGSVTYLPTSLFKRTDGSHPNTGDINVNGVTDQMRDVSNMTGRVENIDEVSLTASEVSINDLRRAIALQSWMEAAARGGARYVDMTLVMFGQRVPDYRLQRAELLTVGKQVVKISDVVSTAETDTAELGDMGGHGVSVGSTRPFTYRCPEHGYIMVILSVMPDTAYGQGIPRMFSRFNKFDYAWPKLAHIGEQATLSKEVYYSFDVLDDDENNEEFGYIPRYSEYKFRNDRIAGDFRDDLAYLHLVRLFTSRPVLDEQFTTMYENGGSNEQSFRRIFNVTDGTDYLWMQIFHKATVKRSLPYFGVPSF